MKPLPVLFGYCGSKRWLVRDHSHLFPKSCSRVIEPFCGTGAVTGAMIGSGRATGICELTEYSKFIFQVLYGVKNYPMSVKHRYEMHSKKDSKDYFSSVKKRFLNCGQPDYGSALYLASACFGGASRPIGELSYGFRSTPQRADSINCWNFILNHCKLINGCGIGHLKSVKIDSSDFVFIDPPYFGSTKGCMYGVSFGEKENLEIAPLLDKIDRSGAKFMLTNTLKAKKIKEIYGNYEVIELSRYSKKNRKNYSEIIIKNY